MGRKIEGLLTGEGKKFAIVTARFNELITFKLEEGAIDCFRRHGVAEDNIDRVIIPGAFEIPVVADKLAATGKYDAVICLGAVIRGETPHFDQVVAGVTSGVGQIALKHSLPIIYGVLTTDTVEQALNRAGVKAGNKGWDAALCALDTTSVLSQI
jgi:6,7-dimethyl-8-ribityllumazine synthase